MENFAHSKVMGTVVDFAKRLIVHFFFFLKTVISYHSVCLFFINFAQWMHSFYWFLALCVVLFKLINVPVLE